ncbi:excinuclease UvrABC ATPase subunit [Arthrobacter sp. UYEF21]
MVEHDEDTIPGADWIVDVGPGAGEAGGSIVHSGPLAQLLDHRSSVTAAYLSGRKAIAVPEHRRPVDSGRTLGIVGARANNRQNVDVDVPLGVFVAVTGVSGPGKSTLVNEILYKVLANTLNGASQVPGLHTRVNGLDQLEKSVSGMCGWGIARPPVRWRGVAG